MKRNPICFKTGIFILAIILIDLILLISGIGKGFMTFVYIFEAVWLLQYFMKDYAANHITVEQDRIIFQKEKRKKIVLFEDIEKITFHFQKHRASDSNYRRMYYHCNLDLHEKKKTTRLHETLYKKQFWNIIQAVQAYNSVSLKKKILFESIIPSNKKELDIIMEGWNKQDKKVLQMIKDARILDYAKEQNIPVEEATQEYTRLRRYFILGFMFILVVIFFMNMLSKSYINIEG